MSKIDYLSWRALGPVLLLAAGCAVRAEAADAPPNFLFIFADDQAFHTINALGNQEIETPHLDRLVRRGLTFTHAYNQGSWSGAVCVASRTMLVTGRYLWHAHQVYRDTDKRFRETGRLWPQLLEKAGYETYFSGKWHIRADAEKAFTVARHVRPGMPNQTPAGYNRPRDGEEDVWKPWDRKFEGFWKGGRHWSEVLGDDAVDYLQRAGKRDKPFFMYLAFNAPHDPRQSPREYVERYPAEKIRVPDSFVPTYPFDIGSNKIRDEKLAPFPRTRRAVQVNRQEYYAIITHMDAQIGRILEALQRTGKADNTYIFFTADHGLACGHHGLMGKQNMYDHSVRVPFVVVGPHAPAGERSATPIYLQDVMPTTLELAGVPRPEHVEFHSLAPLLSDSSRRHAYDAIYGGYLEVQRMVTHEGHKLILYPKIRRALLFDLEKDPQEMSDLMEAAHSTPVARRLFAKLLELQETTGDQLELSAAFPELAP